MKFKIIKYIVILFTFSPYIVHAGLIRVIDTLEISTLAGETQTVWNINDDGKLTGAFNVDVAGTLWDVEFKDESLYDIYLQNSSMISSLADRFQSIDFANALLLHVFLDRGSYFFNSIPSATFGCELNVPQSYCQVSLPTGLNPFAPDTNIGETILLNYEVDIAGSILFTSSLYTDNSISDPFRDRRTGAVWALSPDRQRSEPNQISTSNSISIFMLGFLMLILRRYTAGKQIIGRASLV